MIYLDWAIKVLSVLILVMLFAGICHAVYSVYLECKEDL